MNSKQLMNELKNGGRVYGTLIVSTSPRWPQEVSKLDIDFVFLDAEHMALDRGLLSWMCQTYKALELAPIVRIPSPDPYQASMALDGGASGIIAPYIETPEQVKALRAAVKLRPLKGQFARRRAELQGQPSDSAEAELNEYIQEYNESNLLIVNIESVPALEALDDILAVDQLDAVLIGPHDLSCSLGVPEQYRHPIFVEAVETIISKARAAGVAAGIHYFFGIDQEIQWAKAGLNLLVHASDMTAFMARMSDEIAEIKKALGDPIRELHNRINI
ncbi:aldolase/citrate lyase family protein [Paenibacillus sp. J5C_2022]|uniref:HpcH/HpaI aldolase family protein n=1 Tax=Paenibacillus sp. J5C2022 TaxID=2977129 RepID=UPI0021CF9371|nr:aldolase/citrate lyase family protein [Paenibacillus sp. J5C2022]MCU6711428.1 aldolase/citrate lyase family protein [Paenibacillus sp. J5C2022]